MQVHGFQALHGIGWISFLEFYYGFLSLQLQCHTSDLKIRLVTGLGICIVV